MENARPSIEIVMSTYQGAPFLGEQLRSIFQQTEQHFRLWVRDDGSTDGTSAILADYADRHPGMVAVVRDEHVHLGACASFGKVLEQTQADYIMLSDQDDLWLPRKIAQTLRAVQTMERRFGTDCPILVHTDLHVVDRGLCKICESCWEYLAIDVDRGAQLNRLLIQNIITGCTCMFNRALLNRALPIPPQAVIHDWWLGLVASAFGQIGYLPEATVLYRQHAHNSVGAPRYGFPYGLRRLRCLLKGQPVHLGLPGTARQAASFLERFGGDLPREKRRIVESFTRISALSSTRKAVALLRHGYRKHGLLRNLGMFAEIVLN
ncbi:MAG: glycosyltransferase family 2 protein [Pirellulales bacterium]|nr:glycosyltransferase family 2 protein [Pirellulales bacterium]